MHTAEPIVSIIIPVYNAEKWLDRCIESVVNQTYINWEIVAIDDGSTDDSFKILKKFCDNGINIRIVRQKNQGQGVARNKALKLTKGDFVLFLDSDDFLEPVTLKVCIDRALQDGSDLVHFDWKTASKDPKDKYKYNYFNDEPYWHKKVLLQSECGHLIRMNSYFTVTNMYKKEFLTKWNIRYDEDHIYEDVLFMVQVASRAEKVSLVHAPLYVVQPNLESTTRSDTGTDKHYKGHIHAVKASFEALNPRFSLASAYLAKYHTDRFVNYSNTRVPLRFRIAYAKEFVDLLHKYQIKLGDKQTLGYFFDTCIGDKIFEKKKWLTFAIMAKLKHTYGSQLKLIKNSGNFSLKNAVKVLYQNKKSPNVIPKKTTQVDEELILMLGFDYRYVGNSKFLFDRLRNNSLFQSKKIFFATNDVRVPSENRIEPESPLFYEILNKAGVVVAESWIPLKLVKNPESYWLQLWHGTPLKKVLFDSNEPNIILKNRKHKIQKYKDIIRWDGLLVDDSLAVEKFKTSFLMPEEKLIRSGYPRVQHIHNKLNDIDYINHLKSSLGITSADYDKKVILYAPTWRDYNIGVGASKKDFKYLINLKLLREHLGDEYVILFSDHNFMKTAHALDLNNIIHTGDIDTQDILVISDIVISDYSSIVFDLYGTDKSVILYTPDFIKFDKSRGVYQDIYDALYVHQTSNFNGVVELIKNGQNLKLQLNKIEFNRYTDGTVIENILLRKQLG